MDGLHRLQFSFALDRIGKVGSSSLMDQSLSTPPSVVDEKRQADASTGYAQEQRVSFHSPPPHRREPAPVSSKAAEGDYEVDDEQEEEIDEEEEQRAFKQRLLPAQRNHGEQSSAVSDSSLQQQQRPLPGPPPDSVDSNDFAKLEKPRALFNAPGHPRVEVHSEARDEEITPGDDVAPPGEDLSYFAPSPHDAAHDSADRADQTDEQFLASSREASGRSERDEASFVHRGDESGTSTHRVAFDDDEETLRRLTLGQSDGRNDVSDDEVLRLLDAKLMATYDLEKVFGDKDARAVDIRRKWLSGRLDAELEQPCTYDIPFLNYDYSRVTNACCENVIGYVPVPLGYAGPLKVDGREYFVPMATTEGCLVASTNRGCRAVSVGDGVQTAVFRDSMSRAPVLEFENIEEAAAFARWTEKADNFRIMKQHFDATSRYAKLKSVKPSMAGRKVYVRFTATTGDAMGMNMVSKATEAVLTILRDRYFNNMVVVSISGNVCVDKKAAAMNWIEGRGKSVVAESIVSANVVKNVLKTSVQQLVQLNSSKNLVGSAVAGAMGGFNAHSANIVTAVFLACGQDVAQVVSSSNCLTELEETEKGDLRISCTMPSLEVGTVGGGTILPAQRACLEMMGVAGGHPSEPGVNAKQFARILCATVLAGELSLLAALSAGHLVRSHMKHNRSSINLASQEKSPAAEATTSSKSSLSERRRRPLDDCVFGGSTLLHPESCSKVLL